MELYFLEKIESTTHVDRLGFRSKKTRCSRHQLVNRNCIICERLKTRKPYPVQGRPFAYYSFYHTHVWILKNDQSSFRDDLGAGNRLANLQ